MEIIGEGVPEELATKTCRGAEMKGATRLIHDGAAVIGELAMILTEATHQGEEISLQALLTARETMDTIMTSAIILTAIENHDVARAGA